MKAVLPFLLFGVVSGACLVSAAGRLPAFVVQSGPSGRAAVTVLLDGKPVANARGADVAPDGVARFDRSGMLRLIDRAPGGKHVLTLVTTDPGVRAFAFTFGP